MKSLPVDVCAGSPVVNPAAAPDVAFDWHLPIEAITVRIRWFGLCVGYLLVNLFTTSTHRPELNGSLTLGAVFALLDTLSSRRGRVFLGETPLFVSLMEAWFIGLLCHFDTGIESSFRFYYFLSLLVCAFRNPPGVTYITLALHLTSYGTLALTRGVNGVEEAKSFILMFVFLAWATWASAALSMLVRSAARRLTELNAELQLNQTYLEQRIEDRTKELRESQALLVQQEKQAAFGLLAAGIAHEVGNPLAAISGLVQLMNRRPQDAETHERLALIDEQMRRIQRILRELVDFSRPASHQVTTCDIQPIIESALNVAKYYKRMKGKQVQTSFAESLPRVAIVRDQFVQVFLNLILNSLDATSEGGTVSITTQHLESFIEITFNDDGHGIRFDDQTRLFDPYFTTKETGTGLGLFVCRNIVESSGGSIELTTSSPGQTTFTMRLPVPHLD